MGFFDKQFANVIEWDQFTDDMLFWKWNNKEIKKGSRLIIKAGQDAIFLYNGKVEGVFEDEGSYDIESEIVPFLSTLKGFKFGFNSGIRAEVLFINTREVTVKWGTKSPINIMAPGLPGGMPIRCFGTFSAKISDHMVLIEKVAGIKQQFSMEDVKERVVSKLDQQLMKWISSEGKDMFNLQANSFEIGNGIQTDMDMEMLKIGISITDFSISSFSYPEEIQKMQMKAAGQSMVSDVNKYSQMAMADSMDNPNAGGNVGSDMLKMQMGMMMGQQMVDNMRNQNQQQYNQPQPANPQYQNPPSGNQQQASVPKFCPNCGNPTQGAKFCGECGSKLA